MIKKIPTNPNLQDLPMSPPYRDTQKIVVDTMSMPRGSNASVKTVLKDNSGNSTALLRRTNPKQGSTITEKTYTHLSPTKMRETSQEPIIEEDTLKSDRSKSNVALVIMSKRSSVKDNRN